MERTGIEPTTWSPNAHGQACALTLDQSHATLVQTALAVYSRFVRRLADEEEEAFYRGRAMVRPSRERLSGEVEVDESYVGGVAPGKHGRGAAKKTVVAIAVEKRGRGTGRIRLARIPDTSADSLLPVIEELVEPGSVVCTDGHAGYKPLSRTGYLHEPTSLWATGDPGHIAMPRVHRVSSLLKRWLLGTHQGAVRPRQLDYYLDEFKSGAPAHEFTTEERRRGAARTNEIKRARAAKRREAEEEAAEYGEGADKLLLLEVVERLQQELHCSDCRVALAAAELLLKYLLGPPGRTEEPGLLAPALAFAERMEQGGAHALFTALNPPELSAPAVEEDEDVREELTARLEAIRTAVA